MADKDFHFLIFDLDDTMYRQDLMTAAFLDPLYDAMAEKSGLPSEDVKAHYDANKRTTRDTYLIAEQFGLDTRGVNEVFESASRETLKDDPRLREMFGRLDSLEAETGRTYQPILLTNATGRSALRTMEAIGLENYREIFAPRDGVAVPAGYLPEAGVDEFKGLMVFTFNIWKMKPDQRAFLRAVKEGDAQEGSLDDYTSVGDSLRNDVLSIPSGMRSVWVSWQDASSMDYLIRPASVERKEWNLWKGNAQKRPESYGWVPSIYGLPAALAKRDGPQAAAT